MRLCTDRIESNHPSETGCGYWQLQLDRDLVDTISAIYPEWFRHNMAEGGGSSQTPRENSPKAVVDTSPLHIDQNKEFFGILRGYNGVQLQEFVDIHIFYGRSRGYAAQEEEESSCSFS
ncbi:hypothetical protein HHI36_020602 [Cryptolaemus montrouzieri]|uniref:Uncharacterized protein n=1 Tax=Cryptolaemus montrouzieri TaxID=559131 RepID=A0ABD2NBH2_9CUCU